MLRRLFLCVVASTCLGGLRGTEEAGTQEGLREISPGIFALGKVRINRSSGEITIPAVLNMTNGPLEYLLVGALGKRHESLFLTEAQPLHIHSAMLLIGLQPGGTNQGPIKATTTNSAAQAQPNLNRNPAAIDLPGEGIGIQIQWKEGERVIQHRAENLILNTEEKGPPNTGRWVYNGSRVIGGVFHAQLLGDVVSLVTDVDSIVNNEARGHDNDDVWLANVPSLPPLKTAVDIKFRRLKTPKND